MIGHKSGTKSLIHFSELKPNSWYTITVVEGEYGTPEVSRVVTDKNGEIILAEMTKFIHFERRETHGGVDDSRS